MWCWITITPPAPKLGKTVNRKGNRLDIDICLVKLSGYSVELKATASTLVVLIIHWYEIQWESNILFMPSQLQSTASSSAATSAAAGVPTCLKSHYKQCWMLENCSQQWNGSNSRSLESSFRWQRLPKIRPRWCHYVCVRSRGQQSASQSVSQSRLTEWSRERDKAKLCGLTGGSPWQSNNCTTISKLAR